LKLGKTYYKLKLIVTKQDEKNRLV